MKLTIIVYCDGCGVTLPPFHTDTAYLGDFLQELQDRIDQHRLPAHNAEPCPYRIPF